MLQAHSGSFRPGPDGSAQQGERWGKMVGSGSGVLCCRRLGRINERLDCLYWQKYGIGAWFQNILLVFFLFNITSHALAALANSPSHKIIGPPLCFLKSWRTFALRFSERTNFTE
jgi:hypothetical protein